MKKLFLILLIVSLFLFIGCKNYLPSESPGEGEVQSEDSGDESGPAPNSGDGIPDGPGWEEDKLY